MIRKIAPLLLIILIYALLVISAPDRAAGALEVSWEFAVKILLIFPSVLLLMGLADVWIPASFIKQYLGRKSGIKGLLLSILLGSLPTGPLYIAFPLGAELIKKGASVTNIVIFLSAWASFKIPHIAFEIKFLGIKFTALRLIFTLPAIILIGIITDRMAAKYQNDEGMQGSAL